MTPSDPSDPAPAVPPAPEQDAPATGAPVAEDGSATVATTTVGAPAAGAPAAGAPPAPEAGAPAPAPDPARVLGPGAVLEVCVRAAVLLLWLAVAVVAVVAVGALLPDGRPDEIGTAAYVLALMYGIHLVALAVLGWPGGLLTAWIMRRDTSERHHVLAFGVAGCVLGGAAVAPWSLGAAGVWFVLGGVVAAGARAWTGRARRRRARRRAAHPSEL